MILKVDSNQRATDNLHNQFREDRGFFQVMPLRNVRDTQITVNLL